MCIYVIHTYNIYQSQAEWSHLLDDVDLNKKLRVREDFYNYPQSLSSLKGKTPDAVLKEKLSAGQYSFQVV